MNRGPRKSKRAGDLRSHDRRFRSDIATQTQQRHQGTGLLNVEPGRCVREKRHADIAAVDAPCTADPTLLVIGNLSTGWN